MTSISYEKEPCSRCGGCGQYSYNQMHGSMCYGCQGCGEQLTRKGKHARKMVRQFLIDNYSVAVENLVIGCQIKDYEGYRTVEKVSLGGVSSIDEDGNRVTHFSIRTPKVTLSCRPGSTYQVRPTKEQFNDELMPYARRFSGAVIND